MKSIKVYTKTNEKCMPCIMAKKVLAAEGAEYEEIGVDTEKDLETITMLRNFGYRSFPVIIKEGYHEVVVGFAPDRIKALVRSGK